MTIAPLKTLGLQAEKDQRFDEALNLYRLAIAHAEEMEEYRSVPPLLVRAGVVLLFLNDADQALRLFAQAGHTYAAFGMISEVQTIAERVRQVAGNDNAIFDGWRRTLIECGHTQDVHFLDPAYQVAPPGTKDQDRGTSPQQLDSLGPGPDAPAGPNPPVSPDAETLMIPGTRRSGSTMPPMLAHKSPNNSKLDWVPDSMVGPVGEELRNPVVEQPDARDRPSLLIPEPFVRDTPMAFDAPQHVTDSPPSPEYVWRRRRRTVPERWTNVALWTAGAIVAVILLLKLL